MSDGSGPPVLIGEKVWWLGSGSGLPKRGVVRWIGRLLEIGPDWALGIELDEGLPYGGVDGTWRGRQLFKCKPKHGLIVPSDKVLSQQSGCSVVNIHRRNVSLLPLQSQVSAPPRLRRNHQEQQLLLDRHTDFRSVHLEAVQIRRRIQQDQVVSLVLGQTSESSGNVVLSRGMTGNQVVPRARRTESLAARKEKTNSGLFSFLRWFRRENKPDRGEERSSFSNPGSPVLRRSDSAITGSVDTLFSTATATSFAYIRPESYRPFGEAIEPEKWIFPGPETNTYRNRIKRRDELSGFNQNLSLREKYNLYASGSLGRSLDEIFDDRSVESLDRLQPIESCSSTLARKKRQAPPPPTREDSVNSLGCDSLPTTLSKESLDDFKLHRRTVSESAKYKKKPYHVKGKRKAPPPPKSRSHDLEDPGHTNTRRKRKAPPPPIELRKGNVVNIPKEAALDVIENDQLREGSRDDTAAVPSTSKTVDHEVESVSSTDTLRLERGMLKPNKMDKGFAEPKHAPTSPVSPRPWYKRPQSSGSSPKQNELKKKENKSIEDWMLESGFPRRSQGLPSDSKFNIFNNRPDDKRRSQISILTNISELDREASEIIQRGKEREKSLLASYNAKYYVDADGVEVSESSRMDEGSQTDVVTKKPTAKELISLFNSITNVSRITVNSNFVAKEELFMKNGEVNKNISDSESKSNREESVDKIVEELVNGYSKVRHTGLNKDEQVAGPSGVRHASGKEKARRGFLSARASSLEESRISRVTIEELDEYDSEKSQSGGPGEGKKDDKNPAVSGVTITEVSDSAVKSSSGSTICSSLLNDSSSSLSSGSSSGAKLKSSQLLSNYPLQKKLSMWTCSRCTLENPRWRLTCEACDMWRPTVCDYKLCKKAASSDQPEENSGEVKPDALNSKPKLPTLDLINRKPDKVLDSETSNLISNGQVLASLSARRASSRNKDQGRIKLHTSSKLVKKDKTNSEGPSSEQDISSILSGISSIPAATSSSDDLEQAEVVRKARLAFFNSKGEKPSASVNTDSESVNNMDNVSKETTTEKLKLRELLKEMKNSLPKQRKFQNSTTSLNQISTAACQPDSPRCKASLVKQNSFNESSLSSISSTASKVGTANHMEACLDLKSSRVLDLENNVRTNPNSHNSSKISGVQNNVDNEKKEGLIKSVNGEYNEGVNSKVIIVGNINKSDKKSIVKTTPDTFTKTSEALSKTVEEKRTLISPNGVLPRKIIPTENEGANAQSSGPHLPNEKKAEAIFVKSQIILEEIKVKKKPEKVSSSAQTTTKVLSLDDNSKDSVIVPVTAEEYLLKDNGSIASKSVHVQPMKIDVKKFELMRPRDFTNEAVHAAGNLQKSLPPLNTSNIQPSAPSPSTLSPLITSVNNFQAAPTPSTSASSANSVIALPPTPPTPSTVTSSISAANNLQVASPTLSASSSSCSIQGLNLPIEPIPGPSTSRGDEQVSSLGTVALNRLLKRLEAAISGGQHDAAAGLAKELAKLKVPCSVVRHSPTSSTSSDILMKVLIEDKTSQKGPITMRVKPWVKLADLKRKIEKEHDIPAFLQRWFIDKKLACDDQANVSQMGIEGPATPIFLYFITQENTDRTPEQQVENERSKVKILNTGFISSEQDKIPGEVGCPSAEAADATATLPSQQPLGWRCRSCSRTNKREERKCAFCGEAVTETCASPGVRRLEQVRKEKPVITPLKESIRDPPREAPRPSTSSQAVEREKQENYKRLMDLEKDELVLSVVSFECPVCFVECKPPDGVVLKECLHSFCKACLSKTVEYSEEAEVKCPFRDDTYTCDSTLLAREIKALVTPEVYEEHLAKSIAQAETKIVNAFHCKTPDCKGWCIYEDNVNLFKCPVCLHSNCLTCQAIHDGLDCKQYQEQLNQDSEVNLDAKRTKDMLQEMVDRGEAMPCPRCKVVLMKKWGCDWLRCSMCKTEICWVTRGPRWGPNGKGDTSGGCQCGVNGVKCHPKCNYCH